jgi:hypothetical protein
MQKTEAQQLLSEILDYAKEGKSIEFHFITSWSEFSFIRKSHKATRLVIKTLKASANKLFKTYCKEVPSGAADFNRLLAFAQLQEVIIFYEKELVTMKRMIDEYDEYLGQGHFWYSLLGGERNLPWNTP